MDAGPTQKTSPLHHIHPTAWDPDWTTEAVDLLTVLTRLVSLEADQDVLLARILAASLLSADDLAAAGTRWPSTTKDRKPRFGLGGPAPADMLDI